MASTIWTGDKTFTATSGTETVVPVPVPHRGILRGYRLVQVSGAAAGITSAELYTSNQETEPNASLPEELFRLLDLLTGGEEVVDPDVPAVVENNSCEYAYLNRDGTPTNPQRYLYLRITPAGTGEKTFAFSVTVEVPKLG